MEPQTTITLSPEGDIIRTTSTPEIFTIQQVLDGITSAQSSIDDINSHCASELQNAQTELAKWQTLKDAHDASLQNG